MKDFNFSEDQNIRFADLYVNKQDLITKVLFNTHIPPKYFDDFLNFALEGLAIAFLNLESGKIKPDDFDKFAFSVMKRKVIDEIRRRNKEKICFLDFHENTSLFSSYDDNIVNFEFFSVIESCLDSDEILFFRDLLITRNLPLTIKRLGLSKSSGYRVFNRIKRVAEGILLR